MKNHNLFYFRLVIFILAVIASIWHLSVSTHAIQYFTEQSNIFIEVWLLVALYLDFKEKPLAPIQGKIRGAIILYLSVTFLVNVALLGGGDLSYNNIVQHYVVPIFAFVDWLFTEQNIEYKWSYLPVWLIYPIVYCIVSIIIGIYTSFYPYFFVNFNRIGFGMMILWIFILVLVFVVIGSLLILINRKQFKNTKQN